MMSRSESPRRQNLLGATMLALACLAGLALAGIEAGDRARREAMRAFEAMDAAHEIETSVHRRELLRRQEPILAAEREGIEASLSEQAGLLRSALARLGEADPGGDTRALRAAVERYLASADGAEAMTTGAQVVDLARFRRERQESQLGAGAREAPDTLAWNVAIAVTTFVAAMLLLAWRRRMLTREEAKPVPTPIIEPIPQDPPPVPAPVMAEAILDPASTEDARRVSAVLDAARRVSEAACALSARPALPADPPTIDFAPVIAQAAGLIEIGDAPLRAIDGALKALRADILAHDAAADRPDRFARDKERIAEAIKQIRDVARRSRMVALNATIEAARAGESGRGFAVVASEIKSLSGEASEATDDIAQALAAMDQSNDALAGAFARKDEALSELTRLEGDVAEFAARLQTGHRDLAHLLREASRSIKARVTAPAVPEDGDSDRARSSLAAAIERLEAEAAQLRRLSEPGSG